MDERKMLVGMYDAMLVIISMYDDSSVRNVIIEDFNGW